MSQDHIRATYLIETPLPAEKAVAKMVSDQSTGTFTSVSGETDAVRARFAVRVESIDPLEVVQQPSLPYWTDDGQPKPYQRARVVVRIPLALTETDLITLMSTVAGGLYGLREMSGIRLEDLDLPPVFGEAHPGPQFGVEGTRALAGVPADRPIIASIIKPNVGLTPQQTAAIVRELVEAGVDFIKDDEKMTGPVYSPIKDRVAAIMRVINDHAQKSGRRVMYAFNISHADPEQLVRNHDAVVAAGGTCVMASICQIGIGGMTYLRKRASVPVHAHRNGWDMFTRAPYLGMSFTAFQKIWRLVGVDHLHVNGIRNKFWEPDESVVVSMRACLTPMFSPADRVLPVAGSGMWAGQAPDTYAQAGSVDMIYIAGGGVQGHPDGPGAGVRSIRQAWAGALAGQTLAETAREHPELRRAIEKFG